MTTTKTGTRIRTWPKKKPRTADFYKVKCSGCGILVSLRNERESTTCDKCTMKNLCEYRKRKSNDDEGVVYQG